MRLCLNLIVGRNNRPFKKGLVLNSLHVYSLRMYIKYVANNLNCLSHKAKQKTPILTNGVLENTALPMASSLVIDVNKKVSLTLVSSLVTYMTPILTNGELENMAIPMALPIALLTALPMALPTALPTALSMALSTALPMDLPTDLPIASSFVTDARDKV